MLRFAVMLGLCGLLGAPLAGQKWLHAPMLVGSEEGVLRAAVDLDRDGRPELVRFRQAPDGTTSLRVLQNDGRGGFTPSGLFTLPAWMSPQLLVRDLNRDGVDDLLLATGTFSPGAPRVLAMLGDGAGGFHAPVPTLTGAPVRSMDLADIDGDQVPDLIARTHDTSNQAMALAWLRGLGDGRFALFGAPLALPVPGFTVPWELRAIDVDGDGLADVIGADEAGPAIAIYRTTPTFALQPSAPIQAGIGAGFGRPAIGDVNGDGLVDIVVVAVSQDRRFQHVGVQLGLAGGGYASLAAFTTPPQSDSWPHLLDADGDGDDDLLLQGRSVTRADASSYAFFESVGSGQLVLRYLLAGGPAVLAAQPGMVADLDGDQVPDLIAGGEILFQAPGWPPFADESGAGAFSLERAWADIDGDGDMDRIQNPRAQSFGASHIVLFNDGTGTLTNAPVAWPQQVTPIVGNQVLPVGDLDANGRMDFAISTFSILPLSPTVPPPFLELRRYEFVGDGTVRDLGSIQVGGNDPKIAFAVDIDGDGDPDLVGDVLFRNEGALGFSLPLDLWPGLRVVDSGDVDGDGDLDLLALRRSGLAPHAVLIRNQGASFVQEPLVTLSPPATQAVFQFSPGRFGDLDADGDLDAVVDLSDSNDVAVFRNDGGFFFFDQPIILQGNSTGITPNNIALFDADADGRLDLAVSSAGLTHVLRSTGPGIAFEAPRRFSLYEVRDAVDFDADGDLDVVSDSAVVRNFSRGAPTEGRIQQFGQGLAGSGQFVPLLGATGRARPGFQPKLRIRNAPGGATAVVALAANRASVANSPYPGLTSYGDPWLAFFPFPLQGALAAPGAGQRDIALFVPPALGGVTAIFQVAIADPAIPPSGITHSAGLAITFGL